MSITTLSSRVMYESAWLTVREDQVEHGDGSPGVYSMIDKPDFALVMPMQAGGFHLGENPKFGGQCLHSHGAECRQARSDASMLRPIGTMKLPVRQFV